MTTQPHRTATDATEVALVAVLVPPLAWPATTTSIGALAAAATTGIAREQRPALTAPHADVGGATELLDETRSALVRLGLPAGRIHVHRPDLSRLTTVRY